MQHWQLPRPRSCASTPPWQPRSRCGSLVYWCMLATHAHLAKPQWRHVKSCSDSESANQVGAAQSLVMLSTGAAGGHRGAGRSTAGAEAGREAAPPLLQPGTAGEAVWRRRRPRQRRAASPAPGVAFDVFHQLQVLPLMCFGAVCTRTRRVRLGCPNSILPASAGCSHCCQCICCAKLRTPSLAPLAVRGAPHGSISVVHPQEAYQNFGQLRVKEGVSSLQVRCRQPASPLHNSKHFASCDSGRVSGPV